MSKQGDKAAQAYAQAQGNRVTGGNWNLVPPPGSLSIKFRSIIKNPGQIPFKDAIENIAAAGTIPGIRDWGEAILAKAKAAKAGKLKDAPATVDAIAYMMAYSDDGTTPPLYSAMNAAAYNKDRSKISPYGEYMVGLVKHLRPMPKYPNRTVYRGTKLDLRDEYKQRKKDGKLGYFYSFTSTTNDPELLEKSAFCGQTGKRTFFFIKLTQGQAVDITRYSLYPKESEVLLPPGFCFEVKAVVKQGDLTIIHLEEHRSKHWLIDLQVCKWHHANDAMWSGMTGFESRPIMPHPWYLGFLPYIQLEELNMLCFLLGWSK